MIESPLIDSFDRLYSKIIHNLFLNSLFLDWQSKIFHLDFHYIIVETINHFIIPQLQHLVYCFLFAFCQSLFAYPNVLLLILLPPLIALRLIIQLHLIFFVLNFSFYLIFLLKHHLNNRLLINLIIIQIKVFSWSFLFHSIYSFSSIFVIQAFLSSTLIYSFHLRIPII